MPTFNSVPRPPVTPKCSDSFPRPLSQQICGGNTVCLQGECHPVNTADATLPNYGSFNVGVSFDERITGQTGTAPFTFRIVSGAFPAGISMDTAGRVLGVPTSSAFQSSSVVVEIKNCSNQTAQFTINWLLND